MRSVELRVVINYLVMNVIILVKTQLLYWHGQSPDRCPSFPAVLCHIWLDQDLDVGDLGAKDCIHIWWILVSSSTIVATKVRHRVEGEQNGADHTLVSANPKSFEKLATVGNELLWPSRPKIKERKKQLLLFSFRYPSCNSPGSSTVCLRTFNQDVLVTQNDQRRRYHLKIHYFV